MLMAKLMPVFLFSPLYSHNHPTDSREETVLGSIPLPSYVISPVEPDDHISRKYAFKVRCPAPSVVTGQCGLLTTLMY